MIRVSEVNKKKNIEKEIKELESNICTKPDHLYKRYWCKECEEYHLKDSPKGKKHKDYKLNRYFCKECMHTHVSSLGDGNLFEKHLKHKGSEISYYSRSCSLKCNYYVSMGIRLEPRDAKELNKLNEKYHCVNDYGKKQINKKRFKILLKYTLPERIPYDYHGFLGSHSIIIRENFYEKKDDPFVIFNKLNDIKLRLKIYKIIKKLAPKIKNKPINFNISEFENKIQQQIDLQEKKLLEFYEKKENDLIKLPLRCCNCNKLIRKNDDYHFVWTNSIDVFDLDFIPKYKHDSCIDHLSMKEISEIYKDNNDSDKVS